MNENIQIDVLDFRGQLDNRRHIGAIHAIV
jgi:hypothetical protein